MQSSDSEWREERLHRTSRVLFASVQAPKVSLIADREAFIRADQELFTLSVHCNDEIAAKPQDNPQLSALNVATVNMRTLPGVRLLAEVERVAGFVDLPRLQLFAADLYQDLPQLKAFLETVLDSKIDDEIMEIGATILDLSKKYILRDGLDMDFSLLASIRSENGDIIAAVGTPRGNAAAEDPMSNAYLREGILSRRIYGGVNGSNGGSTNDSETASDYGTASETASNPDVPPPSIAHDSSIAVPSRDRASIAMAAAAYAAAADAGGNPPAVTQNVGESFSAFQARAKFLIADVLQDAQHVQSAITRAANVMERRNNLNKRST